MTSATEQMEWTMEPPDDSRPAYLGFLGLYEGMVGSWGARVVFGGHPAEGEGWEGLNIALADSEYLAEPWWYGHPNHRELWDDYVIHAMQWCEDHIRTYQQHGHTAADITHIWYNYKRKPTSYWEPLPWACPDHRRRGADAGYLMNQLHHEDELQCPTCAARYVQMREQDWRPL